MLLIIPLLIKGLGVWDYGAWVLFVGIVSFLSAILSLGMPQALERFLSTAMPVRDMRECFFSAIAVVCLGGAAGLVLIPMTGPWVASLLGHEEVRFQSALLAWALIATTLNQVALMFFRAQREMGLMSMLELL